MAARAGVVCEQRGERYRRCRREQRGEHRRRRRRRRRRPKGQHEIAQRLFRGGTIQPANGQTGAQQHCRR